MKTVLIIGATGVFGQRLARHVAAFDGIKLVLTSRDQIKAERLCHEIKNTVPNANVEAMAFHKSHGSTELLANIKPFAVIDASGPFQQSDLSFPRSVIASGSHYLDLADARDYLTRFSTLDTEAKAAGVVALAGTSSTPALSSAAVAALTKNWQRIDTLDIAITPGGRSDVGPAVLKAILGYAGTNIETFSGGRLTQIPAWINGTLIHIPGIGPRRVAPVETSDANLLSKHFSVRDHVGFQAGLESPVEQWGMVLLARLRNLKLLTGLIPLAPLLLAARKLTQPFTSDRGAMLVTATGLDENNQAVRAKWSLLAEKGDGPHVPTLPAAAALRKLLAGKLTAGAGPCVTTLSLGEIEHEMQPYAITTQLELA